MKSNIRKRYLCPICDRELSAGHHYCRFCHSFVKEPIVYECEFLPNESDCSGCMQEYLEPTGHLHTRETAVSHRDDNGVPVSVYEKDLEKAAVTGTQPTYRSTKNDFRPAGKKQAEKKGSSFFIWLLFFIIFFLLEIVFGD